MRILQISDTHLGITTLGQIKQMLRKAKREEFDLIAHCGDYSGRSRGSTAVKDTVQLIRYFFPDKPYLTVLGNHDYWCMNHSRQPSVDDFWNNYSRIAKTFKEHNVHFFDEDGNYTHPDYPSIQICGASGWYNNPYPPTNDIKHLPLGLEGDTHRYLLKRAEDILFQNLKYPTVFVSHFPVIKAGDDYKGSFEVYSWSVSLGEFLQEQGVKYFLNGHAHQRHEGPLRWECGSDYRGPRYQIIEVKA